MQDIDTVNLLLRIGIGAVMIFFGISQIKSPDQWLKYIPGFIRFLMPFAPLSFLRVHGLGNITLGLLLASGWQQPLSIWLALAWWLWVSPFAFYYEFTVGLRDVVIILSLISLLVLTL